MEPPYLDAAFEEPSRNGFACYLEPMPPRRALSLAALRVGCRSGR